MPSQPQTFNDLQAWQLTVQNEVLIGGTSPFPLLSSADATLYGATATPGTDRAIFLGVPKDTTTNYPYQCWMTPIGEKVYRKALGGIIFDEIEVYILVRGNWTTNGYAVQKQIWAIRDALHPIIAKHAEQPGATEVYAARWDPSGKGGPQGFFMDPGLGLEWYCWGTTRWIRRQWSVSGGVVQ